MSKVGLFLLLLKIHPESLGHVTDKVKTEKKKNPVGDTKVFITI